MNWLVLPTIALAGALCWAGDHLLRARPGRQRLAALLGLAVLLAVPGVLYDLYYLHGFDDAAWFYRLRALPGSELLAAGCGLAAGMAIALTGSRRRWFRAPLFAVLCLGLALPYLKPVLLPLDRSLLAARWDGEVCMQSTASTCGPASLASVLRSLGIAAEEADLARACFTSASGTEAWYLVRELRRRGLRVAIRTDAAAPGDIRLPAIAGVRVGGSGHFIALLGRSGGSIITGDPMLGRREEDAVRLAQRRFTGFALEITR